MSEIKRLPENARQRLIELRRDADRKRGRPLTDAERVLNLRHAMDRVCWECGGEVEPAARCACGAVNAEKASAE